MITFSTRPTLRRSITDVIEDFRSSMRDVTVGGFTSLWDALALAEENITSYSEKFPGARKRIICLSDGEDTKSTYTAQEVCYALQVTLFLLLLKSQRSNIVLDSFIIGNEKNQDLRTVSYAYNLLVATAESVGPGDTNLHRKISTLQCLFASSNLFFRRQTGRLLT